MIYIIGYDYRIDIDEKDSCYREFLDKILDDKTRKERIELVRKFIITRLLHLKIALEKAKLNNIELQPKDYFLSQINGNSKTNAEFRKVEDYFSKIKKFEDYQSIQIKLIEEI